MHEAKINVPRGKNARTPAEAMEVAKSLGMKDKVFCVF